MRKPQDLFAGITCYLHKKWAYIKHIIDHPKDMLPPWTATWPTPSSHQYLEQRKCMRTTSKLPQSQLTLQA